MKKKSQILVKANTFLVMVALALCLPNYVQAQTMYGVSGGSGGGYSNPGNFMSVDQSSGAVTLLGTPYGGCGLSGVATNSSGRVYAVTSIHDSTSCPTNPDGTSHLIEINPSTGAMIADIGPLYDADGNECAIGDLSFQPGTDILFGLAANQSNVGSTRCGLSGIATGGYLLTINTTNGRYTIIGRDPSFSNSNGGLAFAPNGTLYFTPCWYNIGYIHTLNPANAQILTSQALGSGDCYMGLTVRPSDGTIFGSYRYNNDDPGIYTINPTTGAETLVGNPGNILVHDLTFAGGNVSGTITYTGTGTGPISIAAFDGAGCGQGNYTEVWIPGPGQYSLSLDPGTYYICACRDTNHNGTCPDSGEPSSGYNSNPVIVPAGGGPVTGINISLQGQAQRTESIPTMTEWGMIIFIILAGIGSVYYLRRQRRA